LSGESNLAKTINIPDWVSEYKTFPIIPQETFSLIDNGIGDLLIFNSLPLTSYFFYFFRRHSTNYFITGTSLNNYCTRCNYRTITKSNTCQDSTSTTNPNIVRNKNRGMN